MQTSPAQSVPPQQSAGQTSAVNAGFDASKLGGVKNKKSEKPKKIKKSKEEKTKSLNNDGPTQKLKRPLWFWLVLGILGIAILGVAIWAVVMLVGRSQTNDSGSNPTDLVLEVSSDDGDDNLVDEYLRQLQSISGMDETGVETEANTDRTITDGREAVSKALNTAAGQEHKNEILLAEAKLLFFGQDYEAAINAVEQIDPETLRLKDKCTYYAMLQMSYGALGNAEESQKYLQMQQAATLELFNGQDE